MSTPEKVDNNAADKRRGTLAEANLRLRRQLEVAEVLIPRLNELLEQLQTMQLAQNNVYIGRMIPQLPLPLLGPHDNDHTYKVALMLPGGLGTIVVDSEEHVGHQDLILAKRDASLRFLRFEECPNVVKALILPEVHMLLGRLFTNLANVGS